MKTGETTSSLPSNHVADEEDEGAPAENQVTVKQDVVRQSTKKRKMSLKERMIKFMEGQVDEPNPDPDFFKSILPSVRALQEHQDMDFRMKALSILQQYNFGHSDQFTPQSFSSMFTPSQKHYPIFPHNNPPSGMYTNTSAPSTFGHSYKTCSLCTPSPDVPTPSPAAYSSTSDISYFEL